MNKTLILTFDDKSNTIQTEVYRATLEYITKNLPNTTVYKFTNNQDLLTHVREHACSSVISTNDILPDTAFLLKGVGLVQIVIGMCKELMDISDIIIDPLPLSLGRKRRLREEWIGTVEDKRQRRDFLPAKQTMEVVFRKEDGSRSKLRLTETEAAAYAVGQRCQKHKGERLPRPI